VVEEDAAGGVQVVGLAVVDRDPVPVHLGDAVRRPRVERRGLALRRLDDLAEHLARRRLVEADRRVDDADGVEHAGHADGGELAGQHRLLPGRGHERLGREVVDLLGLVLLEDGQDRHLVQQVAVHEGDAVLEVADALPVDRARAPDHAEHLVALGEQQLGEVRPVLPGDTGDESSLGHGQISSKGPAAQRGRGTSA
jgi:hypothetical protein